MKLYLSILLVLLALFLLIVPAVATDQTVKAGDYIEFNVNAPGANSIQYYVVGKKKFFASNLEEVYTEKLTKNELKECLKYHMYYVYKDNDGNYTIYLKIIEDTRAENHLDLGEYQLIVQYPNYNKRQ